MLLYCVFVKEQSCFFPSVPEKYAIVLYYFFYAGGFIDAELLPLVGNQDGVSYFHTGRQRVNRNYTKKLLK